MNIEPGRIINDFIEPNRRQYAIPVYQRNYEWSKEQCVKLFEDIVQAYKKDKTHFCGSVVYALLKEERNIYHYVVIDGQQRLTTIYLMMKAMLDNAKTEAEKETLSDALLNKDKFDKYGIDTASKLKLKPIKSDNQQLALLMENKYDEVDKGTGIWKNYELFCELVRKYQEEGLTVKEMYKQKQIMDEETYIRKSNELNSSMNSLRSKRRLFLNNSQGWLRKRIQTCVRQHQRLEAPTRNRANQGQTCTRYR